VPIHLLKNMGLITLKRIGNSPIEQSIVGVIANNVVQSYTGDIMILKQKIISDETK